jgi:hypothetical protein
MKRPFKQLSCLFFAFCFAISLVDCVLNDQVSLHEQINSNRSCSDIPTPLDDSHVYHFDDVFYFGSEIQSNKNLNQFELFSMFSVDLKSNFLTCIWQPPKRA